ncbi:hypothetical protein HYC85_028308 [Camellia sinensis]|uniref:Uncharacterized protein n=1 Tax=Camellia sinensis TaxID=4442 RepID=A0A7J7FVK1_CAMSI|nr:hypothetical protein HYC85_028308 [Camellia sinensis]
MEKGYLNALDPQPLPDPLPARHNPTKYCIIAPPQDPNVTTNPLPIHHQVSPPRLNFIHALPSTFNPSIYITPAHSPKPKTLKIKRLNKQHVLELVAKTVDDTFVAQGESILNQGPSNGKGCFTRNTHPNSSPKPTNTRSTPANPFANISKPSVSSSPKQTFTQLHMSQTCALKVLMEKRYLKPLNPRPLPNPLPPTHDSTQYCTFHQQYGHHTDRYFRLYHEIQDLLDNRVITPPENPKAVNNPLPNHNRLPLYNIKPIHSLPTTNHYPSQHSIPANEPKPIMFIPESFDSNLSKRDKIFEKMESFLILASSSLMKQWALYRCQHWWLE